MFASHYTIKVVARSCRFFMFKFIFRFGTISYTVYRIIHSEFGFSHKSIVVSFILICTSQVGIFYIFHVTVEKNSFHTRYTRPGALTFKVKIIP